MQSKIWVSYFVVFDVKEEEHSNQSLLCHICAMCISLILCSPLIPTDSSKSHLGSDMPSALGLVLIWPLYLCICEFVYLYLRICLPVYLYYTGYTSHWQHNPCQNQSSCPSFPFSFFLYIWVGGLVHAMGYGTLDKKT